MSEKEMILAKYTLFVDLDGVLVDFDNGVKRATGKFPSEIDPKFMWPKLARTEGFYADLGWMLDGKILWDFVLGFKPTILTGVPMGKWGDPQKRIWCARELGFEIPVITCKSKEKHIAAREKTRENTIPILVDDRAKLAEDWEAAGGIFILHTSAAESMKALNELGFK